MKFPINLTINPELFERFVIAQERIADALETLIPIPETATREAFRRPPTTEEDFQIYNERELLRDRAQRRRNDPELSEEGL